MCPHTLHMCPHTLYICPHTTVLLEGGFLRASVQLNRRVSDAFDDFNYRINEVKMDTGTKSYICIYMYYIYYVIYIYIYL